MAILPLLVAEDVAIAIVVLTIVGAIVLIGVVKRVLEDIGSTAGPMPPGGGPAKPLGEFLKELQRAAGMRTAREEGSPAFALPRTRCPACGFANPPAFARCAACGAALPARARAAVGAEDEEEEEEEEGREGPRLDLKLTPPAPPPEELETRVPLEERLAGLDLPPDQRAFVLKEILDAPPSLRRRGRAR